MKRILLITCLIMLVCLSCKSKSQLISTNSAEKSKAELETYTLTLQDSLINYGRNYLRVPYRYGGTTARGFDCSGFTSHVYRNFGYNLGRSSRDQASQFPAVQKSDLQTGDLVFFEGRSKNKVVGHVGIVTNPKPNGEFEFIHASVQQGVIVSSSTEAYYASRYLKAGRVIPYNSNVSFSRNTNSNPVSKNYSLQTPSFQSKTKENIVDAIYHTVARGDNLAAISKKYDVPISTIQHLNNLNSKRIKRGQKLLITEAVNVPSIPVVEVQKVDFEKMNDQTSKHDIALEPVIKVDDKSFIPVVSQTTNSNSNPISSQKLEPQEKAEVVVFEPKRQEFPSNGNKHKVVVGESLFSIAKKFNLSVEELKSLNNLTSNSISAGQMLNVGKTDGVTTSIEVPVEKQKVSETVVHTVKKGDTLYSIARQYNCSVSDLRKWNVNLSEAIKIGDKVRVAP